MQLDALGLRSHRVSSRRQVSLEMTRRRSAACRVAGARELDWPSGSYVRILNLKGLQQQNLRNNFMAFEKMVKRVEEVVEVI